MLIEISGVSHRYRKDDRLALNSVSLKIRRGRSLAVMGPSGSGKSTLLSVIGGLLPPSAGKVSLRFDSDEAGYESYNQQDLVAWVTQGTNLVGHRSAVDNVAMAFLGQGMSIADARQQSYTLLGGFELGPHVDKPARHLSGGEAQRVAIARALAMSRPIVLADEPTAQLDSNTAGMVISKLVESTSDRILVVVTHDWSIGKRLDHVVHLIDGTIQGVG